jgi:flagellar motility protein MotE (MotC chaperone)
MDKKTIIVVAAICVVCFGGSFVFRMIKSPPAANAAEPNKVDANSNNTTVAATKPQAAEENVNLTPRGINEKQVKLLVQSLRSKISECDKREQELTVREQRIEQTREQLQKDVRDLTEMQVQLASTMAEIKQEKEKLEQSQLTISQEEAANLKKMATVYDKMDSASASKILINMCTKGQFQDAVKILSFMSDRNAAKTLGEIGSADPKVAGDICMGLKQLKEVK